jgi:TolB-like protein
MLILVLISSIAFSQDTAVATQKITTAVINLKAGNGVNDGESEIISDRLRSELFKTGKVTIMERDQMQEILKEQGFQQSGACTDEACLVEMGQMLGVKHLVVGSLGKLGSMFLVNVRSIDVQTSTVVNVVSVDVKGDIEDLVGKLPDIAEQLVSDAQQGQPPQPQITASEPPIAEQKELPMPDTSISVVRTDTIEEKVEEKKPEKVKVIGKNKDKNENRFGISFVCEIGGPAHHIVNDSITDEGVILFDPEGNPLYYTEDRYDYETTPLFNLQVRFQIKAGPFLCLAIGPGFMFGAESFTLKPEYSDLFIDDQLDISYSVPMIHLGLSYVKRLYPIKINAGGFINFAMPITSYSISIKEEYDVYNANVVADDDVDVGLTINPGLRAGVEFLIGSHFSVGIEGVWSYWPAREMKFNFDEFGDQGYDDPKIKQEIKFPSFKFGLNLNTYF